MNNFNEMRDRIKLYKLTETINEEADRIKSYSLIAVVWANVLIKPRYVVRDTATEQILTYSVTIRKRPLDFDMAEINGRKMLLKIPAYSDEKYTYFSGEVNFSGDINEN